jgi:hypothetical protein
VPLAAVLLQRGPVILLALWHPGPLPRSGAVTPRRTCPGRDTEPADVWRPVAITTPALARVPTEIDRVFDSP